MKKARPKGGLPGRKTALIAVAAALGAYFLLTGTSTEGPRLSPGDAKTVAQGARVYSDHCAQCHGQNLEGQPDWQTRRPDGRMPAPPHNVRGHTWHHPDHVLFQITRQGPAALVGSDYVSDMPAYADILSDEDILAALSYIKSTWPPEIRERHDRMNESLATQ